MQVSLKERLKLYLVMGSVNALKDPLFVLEEAIRGGITAFQFREKGEGALTGQQAANLGKELQRLCKARNVLFIVNDDVELALELGADGIHVGQEDESCIKIRKQMSGKLVGVSAHNVEEAKSAVKNGADYLGVGPMYPTKTKLDARHVQGPIIIREMRQNGILLPLVGIGGIETGKVQAVMEAGADGVAVVSAVSQAGLPCHAAERLLQEINNNFLGESRNIHGNADTSI
jgi:thiamine-phosphate pyrophosphorylase